MWWSLATVATHEYGVLGESRAFFKRLLAMAVVVISIILIAQFTASVTATLTVHQLNGSIHSAADLPGKRIATVRTTTGARYLAEKHLNAVEVERIDDAYPLLEQNRVDAIVFDAPVLMFMPRRRARAPSGWSGRPSRMNTTASPSRPAAPSASRSTRRCWS